MQRIQFIQAALSDVGNVRKVNEDHFDSFDGSQGAVFTVCDGMGGHIGGAMASKLATASIRSFMSNFSDDNPAVTINNALIFANQEILNTAAKNPELSGMGTTATILLLNDTGAFIGHIGDSRIYLFTGGRLHRLTRDHSYVQTLVDAGSISDEDAEKHPRKNELMKALGVNNPVQPTVIAKPIEPAAGDIFLLCSDGLCGLVNDREMENFLRGSDSPSAAAERLINAAKAAGGYDNITVQLVKVTASPFPVAYFEDQSPAAAEDLSRTDIILPKKNTGSFYSSETPGPAPTPVPRRKWDKVLTVCITALVVFFLTVLGVTYFKNLWPFNDTPPSKTARKDSLSGTDQPVSPSPKNLLPGDSIQGDYLIHQVKAPESLEEMIRQRKAAGGFYSTVDFSATYAATSNEIVTDKNLINMPVIRWKIKPAQGNNSNSANIILVHPGDNPVTAAPKVVQQKKVTSREDSIKKRNAATLKNSPNKDATNTDKKETDPEKNKKPAEEKKEDKSQQLNNQNNNTPPATKPETPAKGTDKPGNKPGKNGKNGKNNKITQPPPAPTTTQSI